MGLIFFVLYYTMATSQERYERFCALWDGTLPDD
jgi:hypothetical protein